MDTGFGLADQVILIIQPARAKHPDLVTARHHLQSNAQRPSIDFRLLVPVFLVDRAVGREKDSHRLSPQLIRGGEAHDSSAIGTGHQKNKATNADTCGDQELSRTYQDRTAAHRKEIIT